MRGAAWPQKNLINAQARVNGTLTLTQNTTEEVCEWFGGVPLAILKVPGHPSAGPRVIRPTRRQMVTLIAPHASGWTRTESTTPGIGYRSSRQQCACVCMRPDTPEGAQAG